MSSTKQELEELIRKYYDGKTTLAEERWLLHYFNEQNHSDGYNVDKAQFAFFTAKKQEVPSSSFSARVERLIEARQGSRSLSRITLMRVAAMLIVFFGAGWFVLRTNSSDATRIETAAGKQTHVILPDGSLVWLNEETVLQYDKAFNQERRVVILEGEAYFDVKRDRSRPFIIRTGKATTKVLGTSFNLRSYAREQAIALTVTHGVVNFGAGTKLEVDSGTTANLDLKTEIIKTYAADRNADAWKTRKLIFEDTPMQRVIHDVERYFHIEIEAATPAILQCRFTGNFDDVDLKQLLNVISYSLNITYDFRNGKYFLSGQPCNSK